MKRVLKKVTAALLAATMVVGLAACGSGNGGSGNKSSKSGKVKIEFPSGLQQTYLDHSVKDAGCSSKSTGCRSTVC